MTGNKNSTMVLTIISIIMLLAMVISITFAYFTANTAVSSNLSVTATVANITSPVFTATSSGNLTLNVTTADMLETENSVVAASTSSNINVTLIGGSSTYAVTCSYDFIWTNTGTVYTPTNSSVTEYTIGIVDESNNVVKAETKVNSLTSGSAIVSGLTITSTGSLTTKVYTITAKLYNLNIAQTIYNNTYTSTIKAANVVCSH